MKKVLSIILILAMSLTLFVGCAKEQQVSQDEQKNEQPAEEPKTEEETPVEKPESNIEVTEDSLKTGLAVITSVEKSADAGEKDGVAQTDSVIVAVTVDNEGKIVEAVIDTAQTKINFSKEGKILSDINSVYKSKQELGTEYGMIKASTIGKEWNEQANALADYVVGKTIEEVKGIAIDETTVTTEEDLKSSVTIKIGGYVEALEKAVANAEYLGATKEDKLGLGVITTIAKSKDAAVDKDGKVVEGVAQAYTNITATTFDADGKITSSVIDASQSNVKFDNAGKISTDLAAVVKTKNELGPEYGMAKASSIGKEWNEQAKAFAEYVVGKTVEEVKGLAIDEDGHPTDTDVIASTTVGIGEFQEIIEKAFNSAK